MAPIKKPATKKKPVVKRGLHLNKSSKGFSLSVHSSNGNKLCVLTGYDTRASALKGVLALNTALNKAFNTLTSKYDFTDHTVAPKKK
jgi:hypothetical protein